MSNTNKDSFIDYTFASHKHSLLSGIHEINKSSLSQNNKINFFSFPKQQQNTKNYLYDLKKTFELNYEILKIKLNNNQELSDLLYRIENILKKKEEKYKKKKQIKGKILIEKQIQEEFRRKIEENESYFKEQTKSSEEKNLIKDEYITLFLRKLKEVDIFTDRNSQIIGSGFEKYSNFRIADFVEENTKLFHTKGLLFMDIEEISNNIEEIKQENKLYKIEEKIYIKNKNQNKGTLDYKTKQFIKNYQKNCRVISIRIKLLKNCIKNMSKTIRFLNVPEDLKNALSKKEDEEKVKTSRLLFSKDNNNSMEPSTNLEITKKLESFMDFSIYLNGNTSKINESKNLKYPMKNANFGDITFNWNISMIDKKD